MGIRACTAQLMVYAAGSPMEGLDLGHQRSTTPNLEPRDRLVDACRRSRATR